MSDDVCSIADRGILSCDYTTVAIANRTTKVKATVSKKRCRGAIVYAVGIDEMVLPVSPHCQRVLQRMVGGVGASPSGLK